MNVVVSILSSLIPKLLELLPPQTGRELIDDFLDVLENKIASSETQIDDTLILPLISKLREIAQIPDDIGGDED